MTMMAAMIEVGGGMNIGNVITLALAAVGALVAWGRITARLEAISKAQDRLVNNDALRAALAEMKNDMMERIEKKIEKELSPK